MDNIETFELASRATDDEAARLCSWLDDKQNVPVQINAQNVRRLTVPVLQVLVCAKKQWQDDATQFELNDPSEECCGALKSLGLDPSFFSDKEQ